MVIIYNKNNDLNAVSVNQIIDVTYEGTTLSYCITDLTKLTCRVEGHVSGTTVNIPDTIVCDGRTFSVTEIKATAFYENTTISGPVTFPSTLKTIGSQSFCASGISGALVIPEGVTVIDYRAFEQTAITSLTLPTTLSAIANGTFKSCASLTGPLVIPEGVKKIGQESFAYCSALDGEIVFPTTLTSIGYAAFRECTALSGNLNILGNIKTLESYAFRKCSGITSLTLGDGVETISVNAFYECTGLACTLYIPASVKSIGDTSFYTCAEKLTGIVVDDNNQFFSDYDSNILVDLNNKILLLGCNLSTRVPEGVESIAKRAFYKCKSLIGTWIMPNSLKQLGAASFENTGIEMLIFPEGMTIIEGWSCSSSSKLTSLAIPFSVTNIGKRTFMNSRKIKNMYLYNDFSATTFDTEVFLGNDSSCVYWFADSESLSIAEGMTNMFTTTDFRLMPYEVTFMYNGATSNNTIASKRFVTGEPYGYILPSPIREGCNFLGWRIGGPTGDFVTYDTLITATENHILYAVWEGVCVVNLQVSIPELGKVIAVSDSGTLKMQDDIIYGDEGEQIQFYVVTDLNCRFVCWEADGVTLTNEEALSNPLTLTLSGNVILKAVIGGNVQTYGIDVDMGGMVSIVGDNFDSLGDNDEITFLARPCLSNYEFVSWQDRQGNVLSTNEKLTLTKSQLDGTVRAVFRLIGG